MSVSVAVLLIAAAGAVGFFLLSAVRALPDPIDPAVEERAVIRWLVRHRRLHRFLRRRMDRTVAGGLILTVCLLIAFVVALVVGVLLDMVNTGTGLGSWDDDVAQWGAREATAGSVRVLTVVTALGDTVVVLLALLVTGLVDFLRFRRTAVFAFLAVVFLGEKLLANGLKEVIDRGRPDVAQLVGWAGPSFPSGHAAAAAAVWPAIALILGRGRSRTTRALLAGAAALVTVGVAASRALLGVHWLTDILAGLVIGYGWFLICGVAFGGRSLRLGDPVSPAASTEPAPSSRPPPSAHSARSFPRPTPCRPSGADAPDAGRSTPGHHR